VLDVAAGSGIWGIALAQQSPLVRVTAQDWPAMIPTTRRITQKFGVADRFSPTPEATFSKPISAAITMLPSWATFFTRKARIAAESCLKKVFAALKPGGTIAIGEWLVNDARTEPPVVVDIRREHARA